MSNDLERVKVLLCWHWDPFNSAPGGIERFIEDFIEYAPSHFDFHLLSLTTRDHERFKPVEQIIRKRVCTVTPVGYVDSKWLARLPKRLRYVSAIRRYTHSHPMHGYVAHYHGIEPWFGVNDKQNNAHILLLHKNPSYRWEFKSESKWRLMPSSLYYRLEEKMLNCTDSVFFVNQDCYNDYANRYSALANRMTLMATWVDPESFYAPPSEAEAAQAAARATAALSLPENKRFTLYFGRYDEIKDPLLLIDAWKLVSAQIPDAHLVMVGSGVLKQDMVNRVEALGLGECLSIYDSQSREAIRDLLWLSELSVLPSRSEGMSMAINESLASGCPAVGFDVGDIRRVVAPQRSGEIVSKRGADTLAEAIVEVLNHKHRYTQENCLEAVADFTPAKVLAPLYEATEMHARHLSQKACA